MPTATFPEKVDLYTSSRDLEDLMLTKFPGVIKSSQVAKLKIKQARAYSFLELDGQKLREFLSYYNSFPYKIVNAQTKELVEEKRDGWIFILFKERSNLGKLH